MLLHYYIVSRLVLINENEEILQHGFYFVNHI